MLQRVSYLLITVAAFSGVLSSVTGKGFMLLYRPRDITKACALSRYLRFDLSFGMGMSDTLTLVFRTLFEVDYECTVDLVAENDEVHLLIVIRYPNLMEKNCEANPDAITVLKKDRCLRFCDFVMDRHAMYIIFPVLGRLRFRFISNSSINSDMNANVYQVTATAARVRPQKGCHRGNETLCSVADQHYCFTSGVVCDGIRNCGINDWFDERKAMCDLPVERLGYAPVVAVAGALLCAVVAASHVLLRCLPPQATSFFIFNANEDNRLCIDPVLVPRGSYCSEEEKTKKQSLIPVFDSTSSEDEIDNNSKIATLEEVPKPSKIIDEPLKVPGVSSSSVPRRKITIIRSMTAKIQDTFRFLTGSRVIAAPVALETLGRDATDV